MLLLKLIRQFFLPLLLVFVLLIIPWPGLRDGYATAFRAGANGLFSRFGPAGSVRFEPVPADAGGQEHDTLVHFKDAQERTVTKLLCDSRNMGYLPTVVQIALILATPIAWSRRWRALLWGLIGITGFVAFKLLILVLKGLSAGPDSVFASTPFWTALLDKALLVFIRLPSTWLLVPVLIWIPVTFRRSDWEQWRQAAARARSSAQAGH